MQYLEAQQFNTNHKVELIQTSDKKALTIEDFKKLHNLATQNINNFHSNQKDIQIRGGLGERTIGHEKIDIKTLRLELDRVSLEIQTITESFLYKHPKILIIAGSQTENKSKYNLQQFKNQQLERLIDISSEDKMEFEEAIESKKQELGNIVSQLKLLGYDINKHFPDALKPRNKIRRPNLLENTDTL
jgi:hypothetical protein